MITAKNPYPGIRPFNKEESKFFFGRETQIDTLFRKLTDFRFVAVVGSSGCGKSSLVNAGLLPLVEKDWCISSFRPQNDPIGNLGAALLNLGYTTPEEGHKKILLQSSWESFIRTNLDFSSQGIVDTYKQSNASRKLLIIVDQFEELFQFKNLNPENYDHALRFVNLLLRAVNQATFPIHVMITMRSDFLGDC